MKNLLITIICHTIAVIVILPAGIALCLGTPMQAHKALPLEETAPKAYSTEVETVQEDAPDNAEAENTPAHSGQEISDPEKLESYIKGVVCAEMPALFEEEALKAQAVAARTYTVRALENDPSISRPDQIYQAYLGTEELKKQWGDNYDAYFSRVSDAVDATTGEIMTYGQEPILAVFHSTAAGITENAENIWNSPVPYLKSVESPLDINAPNFEYRTVLKEADIKSKLKSTFPEITFSSADLFSQISIVQRSDAGYIVKIKVGDQVVKGNDFRMALGLRSCYFEYAQQGDAIAFTTKGFGHGAGMSQYGANFMAQEGKSYKEILTHYYSGIDFEKQYGLTE